MDGRAMTDPSRTWAEKDQLTALPTELISQIANHLDDHALLEFRLVCSRASKCAEDDFLRRFFQDRQQLCTEYSLRVLWEISRNNRLRSRFRSLVLVFLDIPYFHVDGHLQRRHQYGTSCDWQKGDNSALDCWMTDCFDHQYETLEWCSDILEAALKNLAAANVMAKIIAIDYRCWLAVPYAYPGGMLSELGLSKACIYGVNDLERSLRNVRSKPPRNHWLEAELDVLTSFVLVAIARAHYPVEALSLGNGDDQNFARPEAFHAIAGSLDFPWQNLKKASLTVTASCLDATRPDFTPFQRWLSSLRALESLGLTFDIRIADMREPWTCTKRCTRLGLCLADMPLRGLTLDNGHFTMTGLLQILSPLCRKLRRIELTNGYLDGEERWTSTLMWMAEHLELEYARFTLGQENGNLRSEAGNDYSGWILSGDVHEVRQKLERMASTAVFRYDSGGVDEESDEFSDDGIADEDFPDIGALTM